MKIAHWLACNFFMFSVLLMSPSCYGDEKKNPELEFPLSLDRGVDLSKAMCVYVISVDARGVSELKEIVKGDKAAVDGFRKNEPRRDWGAFRGDVLYCHFEMTDTRTRVPRKITRCLTFEIIEGRIFDSWSKKMISWRSYFVN